MPRQPRLDAPGVIHHVWARGIERRSIFADDVDRRDLVQRLCDLLPATATDCFGWTFMSNHLHYVLRTGDLPLSEVMRRLNGGYAVRFNRRHERDGYLFQNRYGSRVVKDTTDLVAVIRYVHRNPLEAGLVRGPAALESYPWSGHGALVGRRPALPFESVTAVLDLFDADPDEARRRIRAFVASSLREESGEASSTTPSSPLEALARSVCGERGVSEDDLWRGRRLAPVARAREEICLRAARDLGLHVRAIASALGVTPGSVSQAIRRGEQLTKR